MCLIVDNDVAHRVFLRADDPEFAEIYSCLFTGRMPAVSIVYGGLLRDEYFGNLKVRRAVLRLDQAGRSRQVDENLLAREIKGVLRSGVCKSNDHHIIAIAKVAGVRLLCTLDSDLKRDFKNRRLLDKPAGKVYSGYEVGQQRSKASESRTRRRNRRLLEEFCG